MKDCLHSMKFLSKRTMSCLFTLAALIFLMVSLVPVSSWADEPTIVYDGTARNLKIEDATDSNDLFGNFKELMPGDSRDQIVRVKATGVKGKVRLFVKAVVNESTASVLDSVVLSAEIDKGSTFTTVASGSVGRVFERSVKIAEFSNDGESSLMLHLTVPEDVGNELADSNKVVSWKISAEDDAGPVATSNGTDQAKGTGRNSGSGSGLIQTGDAVFAFVLGLIVLGCVSVLAGLYAWRYLDHLDA